MGTGNGTTAYQAHLVVGQPENFDWRKTMTKATTEQPGFPGVRDSKKRAYLLEFAETANHTSAAKYAGVSVRTAFNWRTDTRPEYREFQQDLEVAEQQLCDRIFAEIARRALEESNDKMLIFLAKRLMPEFRENFRQPSPQAEARLQAERECFDQLKQQEVDSIHERIRLAEMFTPLPMLADKKEWLPAD